MAIKMSTVMTWRDIENAMVESGLQRSEANRVKRTCKERKINEAAFKTCVEGIADSDWEIRKAMFERICDETRASNNTFARNMSPNLVHAETSIRQTVGNLRMLRMALEMHRGLTSDPLADPFGTGPLLVVRCGDSTLIKSIGNAGNRKLQRSVTL